MRSRCAALKLCVRGSSILSESLLDLAVVDRGAFQLGHVSPQVYQFGYELLLGPEYVVHALTPGRPSDGQPSLLRILGEGDFCQGEGPRSRCRLTRRGRVRRGRRGR